MQATVRLSDAGILAEEARLEARLLAQHALGFTREQLITRSHTPIDNTQIEPLLARRLAREPLAYIIGERAFYGLDFYVTPAVLIPRPETELLVEIALEYFAEMLPSVSDTSLPPCPPVIGGSEDGSGEGALADIGTGSGCIAVTLAKHLPEVQVFATDISTDALAVAQKNAERHSTVVTFLQGDLLAPLRDGQRLSAIVSNPPYIARTEIDTLAPEVLGEPHTALFDIETDGLGFYRRLATEAPDKLQENGLLAVEVGHGQAESVAALFTTSGFAEVAILPDLAGIGRVVRGIWRSWPKTASDEEAESL